MKYEELRNFILEDMKPDTSSGEPKNYQPVMILVLNQNHGKATKKEIINALEKANSNRTLSDGSFSTVCKTLQGHKIVERKGDEYFLLDYDTIDKFFGRKAEITKCCYEKIQDLSLAASTLESIPVPKMKNNPFWLASGSWGSWDHTINNPPIRWGTKAKNLWEKLAINDIVFCSASSKRDRIFSKNGIFMVGKVKRKFELEKNDGYYPDARDDKENFFKYRFELEPLKIVKTDDELLPLIRSLTARQSINHITNPQVIKELLGNLESMWKIKLNMETSKSANGLEELIQKFDKDRYMFWSERETPEERESFRKKILQEFPPNQFLKMKIENYVIGSKRDDTFCYYLENIPGFGATGKYSAKYGVYWRKDENDYRYKTKYPDYGTAFEAVKNTIDGLITQAQDFEKTGNWGKLGTYFENSEKIIKTVIKSKILAIYFPQSFLLIHSLEALRTILDTFRIQYEECRNNHILLQEKILEIKNSHPIMKNWNNQDYSHFLWSAIDIHRGGVISDVDMEKGKSGNYYIISQYPDSKYDDIPGVQYAYDSDKANYKNFVKGTNFIVQTKIDNQNYFMGCGKISEILTDTPRVKKNGRRITDIVAKFSGYTEFQEKKIRTEDINKKMLQLAFPNKGTGSQPPSMLPITKDIYDEIVNGRRMSSITISKLANDHLTIPSKKDIEQGIKEIQKVLLIDDEVIKEIVVHLAGGRHVLLSGPVGTGKTKLAQMIPETFWKENGGYFADVHTATADWSTYDVIGGLSPKMNSDAKDGISYEIEKGCVTKTIFDNFNKEKFDSNQFERSISTHTIKNQLKKFHGTWLVIDEFNRADIDKAFGQLFTALEYKKLQIPSEISKESFRTIPIPNDYRIIGTLNTADKHYLFNLSDALKRRFAYVEIPIPKISAKNKQREIFLSIKYGLIDIDDDFTSLIQVDEKELNYKIPTIESQFNKAFEILSFIRQFKPLGTAILKSIYQTMLVSIKIGDKNSLDRAINANIIPQLENLPKSTLEIIYNFLFGDVGDFLLKSDQKERYLKDMYSLFGFVKFDEEKGIESAIKQYASEDAKNIMTKLGTKVGDALNSMWLEDIPAKDMRKNMPIFSNSLLELIKQTELF